nr:MAG TPA: hypothetical protein [Caudoviricetes sp.]
MFRKQQNHFPFKCLWVLGQTVYCISHCISFVTSFDNRTALPPSRAIPLSKAIPCIIKKVSPIMSKHT